MKEMLSDVGTVRFYRVYFGKSRIDVEARNVHLRVFICKDLELISKSGLLKPPAWSNGCDTIERFELSLNSAEANLGNCNIYDYRPKRRIS